MDVRDIELVNLDGADINHTPVGVIQPVAQSKLHKVNTDKYIVLRAREHWFAIVPPNAIEWGWR